MKEVNITSIEKLSEYINSNKRIKKAWEEYLKETEKNPIFNYIIKITLEAKEKLRQIYLEYGEEDEKEIKKMIETEFKLSEYPQSREIYIEKIEYSTMEAIFYELILEKVPEKEMESFLLELISLYRKNIQNSLEYDKYDLYRIYGAIIIELTEFLIEIDEYSEEDEGELLN